MGIYYFDTSALVKLYIREVGSAEALALAENTERNRLAVLDLARVEARAAIRKRERMGDLSAEAAASILSSLEEDLSAIFLTQPSNADVVEQAIRLLDLYPLKAYDAVQLAGCIALAPAANAVTLVSADRQIVSAATAEGIRVINPEVTS